MLYGYLGTSSDSGNTWALRAGGVTQWNWVASSSDASQLLAAGGPVVRSTDGGTNWQNTLVPNGNWTAVACSADGSRIVVSEYPGRLASSVDGGANWKVDNAPNAAWNGVAMSADGSTAVAVVYGGGIWVSRSVPVPPVLGLAVAGGQIVLAWLWPSGGFGLQETSDLTTTNWMDVLTAPAVTNGQNQVTLPVSPGHHFYRLESPSSL